MSARAVSVFQNRSFSLFYLGQAFSYVGDGLRLIAIPLLVYHLTGSALSIGVTYALELGPFAIFGLLGGSFADRLDRRRTMILCDAARFLVMLVFAIGYAYKFLTIGILYTGIVAMSVAAAIFVSSQSSTIPYLVGKERATRAISALLAAEQVSQTILPPIGGALFALLGPMPALCANAVTYLVSQLSIAAVDDFGPPVPKGVPSLREIGADVATGYRFLWSDAAMRTLSGASLLLNFFGMMCGAVVIPYLKRDFAASDAAVGYALGITAVGAFAGSWLAGRVPAAWPFGRVIAFAYLADGLFFIPVALTHDLRVAVIFMAISSGCFLFEIAQIVGWRMRVIPEDLVGRVFGAVRLVVLFGTVPGALAGGALADRFGARIPLAVSCLGYLVMAVLVAALPVIRRERR